METGERQCQQIRPQFSLEGGLQKETLIGCDGAHSSAWVSLFVIQYPGSACVELNVAVRTSRVGPLEGGETN